MERKTIYERNVVVLWVVITYDILVINNNKDALIDPDTDEFANLDNWKVIPVKNFHQHKHENCYVEGIKHYNTQNGITLYTGELTDCNSFS